MRRFAFVLLTLWLAGLFPASAWADALERLDLERLRAAHERVEALKHERRPVTLDSGYDDVRAVLHVHSGFSHDSRGSISEIVAGAKQAGVRVILFTEHPNKFS